jgi:bis(5'-nucleosidyl)-tetraphosphatase
METGPYNKGKIARYYIARSKEQQILLPVNPDLGVPEHQEARWVSVDMAMGLVSARLKPVVRWSYNTITHGPGAAAKSGGDQSS